MNRRPMKISADRNSPYWFHGITQFSPYLNGKRMDNVLFADEEEGVMDIRETVDGEVTRLYGKVEIRPAHHLNLVKA